MFSRESQHYDVTISILRCLKKSQSFQGLIQVFFSVCQLCDGGMTLRSVALSFSYLNANERAAVLVKALQKQCEFLISYHTKR